MRTPESCELFDSRRSAVFPHDPVIMKVRRPRQMSCVHFACLCFGKRERDDVVTLSSAIRKGLHATPRIAKCRRICDKTGFGIRNSVRRYCAHP